MMKLVKLNCEGGAVFVNPDEVAAVLSCSDSQGRPLVGACGVMLRSGGSPILVSHSTDQAAKALASDIIGPPAAAGFNGRLSP